MELVEKILSGDVRTISRMITKIERDDPDIYPILKSIYAKTGHAHVVGLTGPPGAGKSSLINALIQVFLTRNKKIAVVAVDPSSEFTGGGVLGDRIRMRQMNDNLYIRSLGARGHLGGLSCACGNAIHLLDAAGFDLIFVETVGTGQSETEIKKYANTVIVVANPNQGDDVQSLKAGILEIGDIFAVNKADLPGAEFTISDLTRMTHLNAGSVSSITPKCCHCTDEHTSADMQPAIPSRIPPVIAVSTFAGFGIEELADAIEEHYAYLQGGLIYDNRLQVAQQELSEQLRTEWETVVLSALKTGTLWAQLSRDVAEKNTDPWSAKSILWEALMKSVSSHA